MTSKLDFTHDLFWPAGVRTPTDPAHMGKQQDPHANDTDATQSEPQMSADMTSKMDFTHDLFWPAGVRTPTDPARTGKQ